MSGSPSFRLDGQAAIVTGASSGLGAIIADALADAGCAVVLAARREQELARGAAAIVARGGQAVARRADLRDPAHAEDLVRTALEAFGRLDGVVLNAGASTIAAAAEEDLAAFADVLAVNVTAQMALAAAAARQMIGAGRGGWMIAQSSILARKAGTGPGVAAYTASKAAIEQLIRELARQWAPHGIRVNGARPRLLPHRHERADGRRRGPPGPAGGAHPARAARRARRPRRGGGLPREPGLGLHHRPGHPARRRDDLLVSSV